MRKHMSAVIVLVGLLFTFGTLSGVFAQQTSAMVRVAHASPDAPAVDVYVNGAAVLTDVEFFTVSDYLDLAPGEYLLQIVPAGEAIDAAVISTTATVAAGRAYTIAAINAVNEIDVTIIEDDLSAPPTGQAKVRALHFSPDAPNIEVYIVGSDEPFISDLAYPNASGYQPLDPGFYVFNVSPEDDTERILQLEGATVGENAIYDLFVVGDLEGWAAQLVAAPVMPGLADVQPETPTPDADATPDAEATPPVEIPIETDVTPVTEETAPEETPAADVTPTAEEPDTTPAPTPDTVTDATPTPTTPTELPVTSGSSTPLVLFGFVAFLLLVGGMLLLRRAR